MSDRLRSLCLAFALLGCLSGPILEVFDQWDQPLQSSTDDTEANILIIALCVGLAFVATRALFAFLRRHPSAAYVAATRFALCGAFDLLLIPARLDIRPHAPPLRV